MMNLMSVILGMLLVFLIFSVAVSYLRELIAHRLADRGRFLRDGVYRLIGDDAVAARLLHHALIGGLYRDPSTRTRPPSYVDPASFALALSHIIVRRGAPPTVTSSSTAADNAQAISRPLTYDTLRTALSRFADQQSQLAIALLPVVDRAAGDLQKALDGIEHWFTTGMDRVSGWYKAYARKQLFWLGLLLAAALNIDSIEIFRHLNRNPEEAEKLAQLTEQLQRTGKLGNVDIEALATRTASNQEMQSLAAMIEDRATLGTLPIGYACLGAAKDAGRRLDDRTAAAGADKGAGGADKGAGAALAASLASCQEEIGRLHQLSVQQWLLKGLGWILTAFAGSLGAAYWFAAISKVMNVRGSGPPPEPAKPK